MVGWKLSSGCRLIIVYSHVDETWEPCRIFLFYKHPNTIHEGSTIMT